MNHPYIEQAERLGYPGADICGCCGCEETDDNLFAHDDLCLACYDIMINAEEARAESWREDDE